MQPKSQGLEDPGVALWETPVQPWLGSQIRAVTNSEVINLETVCSTSCLGGWELCLELEPILGGQGACVDVLEVRGQPWV